MRGYHCRLGPMDHGRLAPNVYHVVYSKINGHDCNPAHVILTSVGGAAYSQVRLHRCLTKVFMEQA